MTQYSGNLISDLTETVDRANANLELGSYVLRSVYDTTPIPLTIVRHTMTAGRAQALNSALRAKKSESRWKKVECPKPAVEPEEPYWFP